MSRLLDHWEYPSDDFGLGDGVSFEHNGMRLYGIVVRVYNSRDWYHVEVHGQRYEVGREDQMRREL